MAVADHDTTRGETVVGGNTGKITFGQDGSPSSFTFDDGSTQFRFDPMNGSNEVDVNLNVGSPGSFTGITQFAFNVHDRGPQPGRISDG